MWKSTCKENFPYDRIKEISNCPPDAFGRTLGKEQVQTDRSGKRREMAAGGSYVPLTGENAKM